jgi:hypothetical protein
VLPAKLEVAEALLVGRVDVVSGDGVVVAVQHLEELVSFASGSIALSCGIFLSGVR